MSKREKSFLVKYGLVAGSHIFRLLNVHLTDRCVIARLREEIAELKAQLASRSPVKA